MVERISINDYYLECLHSWKKEGYRQKRDSDLVGMQNSKTTLGKNLAVAYILKHTSALLSSLLTSRLLLKGKQDACSSPLKKFWLILLMIH